MRRSWLQHQNINYANDAAQGRMFVQHLILFYFSAAFSSFYSDGLTH